MGIKFPARGEEWKAAQLCSRTHVFGSQTACLLPSPDSRAVMSPLLGRGEGEASFPGIPGPFLSAGPLPFLPLSPHSCHQTSCILRGALQRCGTTDGGRGGWRNRGLGGGTSRDKPTAVLFPQMQSSFPWPGLSGIVPPTHWPRAKKTQTFLCSLGLSHPCPLSGSTAPGLAGRHPGSWLRQKRGCYPRVGG